MELVQVLGKDPGPPPEYEVVFRNPLSTRPVAHRGADPPCLPCRPQRRRQAPGVRQVGRAAEAEDGGAVEPEPAEQAAQAAEAIFATHLFSAFKFTFVAHR